MDPLNALRAVVGGQHVLTGADAEPSLTDWRERYTGQALAVVRPGSTAEVAGVVRACAQMGIPIVPQGGNTGLCGGATPDQRSEEHTSELQSLMRISYAVFCLKKKNQEQLQTYTRYNSTH